MRAISNRRSDNRTIPIDLILSLLLALAAGSQACSDECDSACDPTACIEGKCAPASTLDSGVSDAGIIQSDGSIPDANTEPTISGLTITPTSAALLSRDGAQPTVTFSVIATWSDGRTEAVDNAAYGVTPAELGVVADNVFTANGRVGGPGRVRAEWRGVSATAQLRIELEQTILVGNTSTTVPPLFEMPGHVDPAREAGIVYPLDHAVMPQNVPPAEIQWTRSAPGDAFRISLQKPNVRVFAFYTTAATPSFTNSWLTALDAWRRIAQSEPDQEATITVDRYEAATDEVISGSPVHLRFPRAALLGSVYYWDIERGRIVRIQDGTAEREEFLPNPPTGCVGCHSVSTSGRYMAGRFGPGENIGGVFDLTQDLTGLTPPTTFPVTSTTARWWFSAWSPAEDRMIVTREEQSPSTRALALLDPFRGTYVTPVEGALPTGPVTHPAWSPDGSAIAYIGGTNTWGGENSTGDLWILPVTGPDAFGTPQQIYTGTTAVGNPIGNAANYPTWSPNSQLLAIAHGTSSRSESGRSALYLIKRDGTGIVRLDRANGGVDRDLEFQPRFSPFVQDGYFWLTFLSRRDYGNALAGTLGSSRQQIWVSAIKIDAAPGEDPSEVAYWLPGQNRLSRNISAYWAPRACRELTETCSVDAECCGGACSDEGVCVELEECRQLGETCTDNEQCCGDVLCVGGTCGGL